jgi:hypothetical protein
MYASYQSPTMISSSRQVRGAEVPLFTQGWERTENPQAYDIQPATQVHVAPKRHMLGMVGGNDVSVISGNVVDLESDLRGITRVNTFAPWRSYQPPAGDQAVIRRSTPKGQVIIDTRLKHLPAMQAWGYATVHAPDPIVQEVCSRPEKY